MARGMIKNMVVVAAALTMLILIESTAAETFIVGDDNGWSIPPSAGFYSSWAAKHTFAVNDTLGKYLDSTFFDVLVIPECMFHRSFSFCLLKSLCFH